MDGKITLPVFDRTGTEVGSLDVDPAAIASSINRQLLHDVVVMYQANRRQGTAKTKGRGEVAGSTRKLYRQKGTGHARMGARRTNVRRGGGVAFAKRPRDFGYRMPKKIVRAATRMALLSKLIDNETTVIDSLDFAEPKTRDMIAVLEALNLAGESCLITPASYDPVLWKSARNIDRVRVSPAPDLNALDLLSQKRLLITRAALEWLERGDRSAEKDDRQS